MELRVSYKKPKTMKNSIYTTVINNFIPALKMRHIINALGNTYNRISCFLSEALVSAETYPANVSSYSIIATPLEAA